LFFLQWLYFFLLFLLHWFCFWLKNVWSISIVANSSDQKIWKLTLRTHWSVRACWTFGDAVIAGNTQIYWFRRPNIILSVTFKAIHLKVLNTSIWNHHCLALLSVTTCINERSFNIHSLVSIVFPITCYLTNIAANYLAPSKMEKQG